MIKEVDAKELIREHGVLKGLDGDKLGKGYFNPEAGWVDAASATKAYLRIAESRGAKMPEDACPPVAAMMVKYAPLYI